MRLVLASRSERRAALLAAQGYAFEQAEPPFADPPTPRRLPGAGAGGGAEAAEHAVELARRKAESLRAIITGEAVILAADTICVAADGRLVGTPETRAEAEAILRSFVGDAHQVVTGVAVVRARDDRWWFESDIAAVTWGQVDDARIAEYVRGDEWRGKAGGYNLFDRQRAGWPIRVGGDPATVVGLPMRKLVRVLERAGVAPAGYVALPGAPDPVEP